MRRKGSPAVYISGRKQNGEQYQWRSEPTLKPSRQSLTNNFPRLWLRRLPAPLASLNGWLFLFGFAFRFPIARLGLPVSFKFHFALDRITADLAVVFGSDLVPLPFTRNR